MNEQLQALFEGKDLSEDFKSKVESLIESRVEDVKVEIKEQAEEEAEAKYASISEDYSKYVISEMEDKTDQYIAEELVPTVERYLDYAVGEFVKENKAIIESQTKVELADKFLSGLKAVSEDYNVVVPEGQDDVVAKLQAKVDEANARFDKQLAKLEEAEKKIVDNQKEKLVSAVTEGMTETSRERFAESAKDIKFVNEGQYKDALVELKESYSPADEGHKEDKENIDEGKVVDHKEQITESDDNSYLAKLSKML